MQIARCSLVALVAGVVLLAGCGSTQTPVPQTPSPSISAPADTAQAFNTNASPTPIPGFPENQNLAEINEHVAAGDWGFAQFSSSSATTDAPATAGIRINGVWKGRPGELTSRPFATQEPDGIDLTRATPYYLSWSYVITDGDPLLVPEPITMPHAGDGEQLYVMNIVTSEADCPDYSASLDRGHGIEVRRCTISLSATGDYPIGLAFPVPQTDREYWFFDAPPAMAKT
jgi:hypothetical protein